MTENEMPEPEEPVQQSPAEDQEEMEAAPTDFGRNVWLLVIILGVVVLAWVVALVSRPAPSSAPPAATGQASGVARPEPGPTAVQPSTPAPAPPTAAPVSPVRVVGTNQTLIVASPARRLNETGTAYRMPMFFDVSVTSKGFDARELTRMPGRWAGQRPVLAAAGRTEEIFQPAFTVESLADDDRVAVVSIGEETHVYPLDLLGAVAGVKDVVGGKRVFVTYSPFTQFAGCLQAVIDDKPVEWLDAGHLYRGNELLFDGATGSLWDPLSGVALSGPLSGRAAHLVPTQVWPWGQWVAAEPESTVLNPPKLVAQAKAAEHTDAYLESPIVPIPVVNWDGEGSPLPPKAFVLGIAVGDQAKAYPLAELLAQAQTNIRDTVGERQFEITITSARTARATSGGEPVAAPVMLWFAWKEAHPQSAVYGAVSPPSSATE